MILTHQELQRLAKGAACSERAIERLLGTAYAQVSQPDGGTAPMQLGINVIGPELGFSGQVRDKILAVFESQIREYQNTCPRVTAWLQRGDFDPTKIPELVKQTELVHACRTASRLRASCIRLLTR